MSAHIPECTSKIPEVYSYWRFQTGHGRFLLRIKYVFTLDMTCFASNVCVCVCVCTLLMIFHHTFSTNITAYQLFNIRPITQQTSPYNEKYCSKKINHWRRLQSYVSVYCNNEQM